MITFIITGTELEAIDEYNKLRDFFGYNLMRESKCQKKVDNDITSIVLRDIKIPSQREKLNSCLMFLLDRFLDNLSSQSGYHDNNLSHVGLSLMFSQYCYSSIQGVLRTWNWESFDDELNSIIEDE